MAAQEVRSVLIVEDDELLRASLRRFLTPRATTILEAESVAAATTLLQAHPQLILLDVRLNDGSGLEVAQAAARLMPAPLIVAISGDASPEEAFRLAQLGVRQYLQKPFTLEQLEGAILRSLAAPPELMPHIAGAVGHLELGALKTQVRHTMVRQALAMTGGNRSAAARLLGVSRQALQHIVRHDHVLADELPADA